MNTVTKIKTDEVEPIPPDTLAGALAAAFAEIEAVTKSANGQVGQQKYKYADITAVIEAIKPALIKHGLFFTQRPQPTENGVCVETVIGHASGGEMSLGTLFVPANKQDAQGFGSALTYARRYALVTAFGVPVEDDDGNAAVAARNPPQPAREEMPGAEWAKLVQLVEVTKTDVVRMCKNYGVNNLKMLNKEQYAEAVSILEDRLAKMAKADTNTKADA